MSNHPAPRALISVYDKAHLLEFARTLHSEFGFEILSTGGTARHLAEGGIPVTPVEDLTGFPEMLDGRVKTLHPRIHAAVLADRDNPEHRHQLAGQDIRPIDLVVVNLYPFEQTVTRPGCTPAEAIEMIDIGGPCLLRAAAKNHRHVLPVCAPSHYDAVLDVLRGRGETSRPELARTLAAAAFALTCRYDRVVSAYLSRHAAAVETQATDSEPMPPSLRLSLSRERSLRYGENPHQSAAVYVPTDAAGPSVRPASESAVDLSYNNHVDADAAWSLCADLTRATDSFVVCLIKHTNACGVGVAEDPTEAYRRAYLGDPNAAMGGILAVNFPVDAAFAETVMQTYARYGKPLRQAGASYAPGGFFVEVWLAPAFEQEAVPLIRGAKEWGRRVRLLGTPEFLAPVNPQATTLRTITGGMLVQTSDHVGLQDDAWRVVTDRAPDPRERADLRLAWLVCKHTRSNAVTICRDGMLLGNGAGQMSRVMSARIAEWSAGQNGHAQALAGAVAASDAFFPFRDGPDILMKAGLTALVQPGGSKRDDDVIRACNERQAAMVFTGTRHFRH
jgi:phosphoribosylaminoimidazolecarboxamide formyltransferase/IMP cyclohydrolase